MQMIMIAYNESVDMEVMEIIESCGVRNYSKAAETFGRGGSSGTHLGTDTWPGLNNILFAACPGEAARKVLAQIRELRKPLGKTGVKAFSWKLDEMT